MPMWNTETKWDDVHRYVRELLGPDHDDEVEAFFYTMGDWYIPYHLIELIPSWISRGLGPKSDVVWQEASEVKLSDMSGPPSARGSKYAPDSHGHVVGEGSDKRYLSDRVSRKETSDDRANVTHRTRRSGHDR